MTKQMTEVKFFLPGGPGAGTNAVTLHDDHRLPQFQNTGQLIIVNPKSLQNWSNNWNLGIKEIVAMDRSIQMATTPAVYNQMGYGPIEPNSPYRFAPIDLLGVEDQQKILLHEVSTAPTCGSGSELCN